MAVIIIIIMETIAAIHNMLQIVDDSSLIIANNYLLFRMGLISHVIILESKFKNKLFKQIKSNLRQYD